MSVVKLILTNSKFWTAVFVLINALVYYFFPDFPEVIWVSIDGLVSVVLSIMLVGDVRRERAAQG